MDLAAAVSALDTLSTDGADRDRAVEALRLATRARRLIDAIELRWTRLLADLAGCDPAANPEHECAEATQRSLRHATATVRRATRSVAVPVVADAVEDGSVSADHLDAFLDALESLAEHLRPRLLELQHELVRVAATSTVEDFRRRMRAEVRTIEGDDGVSRLARQRRDTGVRTWTGRDGMWNLHGRFDPATALALAEALRRQTETIFHGDHPAGAPTDPVVRHQWFQAHALATLMTGGGSGSGAPEFAIVIDLETYERRRRHPGSRVECGCDLEVPIEDLVRMGEHARFVPVILGADGRVIAEGGRVASADELFDALCHPVRLDRGRTRPHADRAQRHALRAMYRHCAIPGCRVPFGRCEIHHLRRWEDGGPTDLDNLVPVCAHHHDRLHADGWVLELGADRSLTVRRQGVVIMSTGPPTRQWAA